MLYGRLCKTVRVVLASTVKSRPLGTTPGPPQTPPIPHDPYMLPSHQAPPPFPLTRPLSPHTTPAISTLAIPLSFPSPHNLSSSSLPPSVTYVRYPPCSSSLPSLPTPSSPSIHSQHPLSLPSPALSDTPLGTFLVSHTPLPPGNTPSSSSSSSFPLTSSSLPPPPCFTFLPHITCY
ncbi:hypothetical protein E2C01_036549 [Portunus trituberculatus]|uniref:Uncharacterized protein n=1 Tax=Portunus trituberculatus TaxID=210409 RepID=A0A5B7FC86_PORTR|nr:hypothetical protein [Portunus trituberculatus]